MRTKTYARSICEIHPMYLAPMQRTWFQVDERNLRFVCPFLLQVMYGVKVIFNEMSLPRGERAGGEVVLDTLSRTQLTDKTEQLTRELLRRGGTKPKGVGDLNNVVKREDRGKVDIVKQVFQKAVDLGFCTAQGPPLNEYVGGRGARGPRLVPVWHTSSSQEVRARASLWGLIELGTRPHLETPETSLATDNATPSPEPPFQMGMAVALKRPAATSGMAVALKRPAATSGMNRQAAM